MAKVKKQEQKPEQDKTAKTANQRFWSKVAADLAPYARSGLVDLQNAVVHAFPESQQQSSQPGLAGQVTQMESYQERHAEPAAKTAYERWLESKGKQAETGKEAEKQKQIEPELG